MKAAPQGGFPRFWRALQQLCNNPGYVMGTGNTLRRCPPETAESLEPELPHVMQIGIVEHSCQLPAMADETLQDHVHYGLACFERDIGREAFTRHCPPSLRVVHYLDIGTAPDGKEHLVGSQAIAPAMILRGFYWIIDFVGHTITSRSSCPATSSQTIRILRSSLTALFEPRDSEAKHFRCHRYRKQFAVIGFLWAQLKPADFDIGSTAGDICLVRVGREDHVRAVVALRSSACPAKKSV
jgi:hypothetical protein